MKRLLAIFVLVAACTQAFAQERVELNKSEIHINNHEAIIVRTSATPDKLKITTMVPMSNTACLRWDTRLVLVSSGAQCGYAVSERRVNERHCVQTVNGRCVRYENRVRIVRASTPRTCQVAQSFCADYGTETIRESDGVVIKFKNATELQAGEEETFLIRARQKNHGGSNVVYEVEPVAVLKNYEIISRGILGSDRFVIKGE